MNVDAPAPAGGRAWRRDVVQGATYRFAIALVPAMLLAVIARILRGDLDRPLVANASVVVVLSLVTLSSRVTPWVRGLLVVGVLVWVNAALMYYARYIPLHGVTMPVAAGFAALIGGPRWGWPTLALTSAIWLVPWISLMAGGPVFLEMAWPSQYLRLWFLQSSLAAGMIATINHVTWHLEASVAQSDTLLERVREEARAVQALAGRVREAEENERRRLAHDLHDDFGQRLTALRMKLQLSKLRPDQRTAAIDDSIMMSEELLQDVRAFAHGLRPPLLDEVGLGPALRALVEAHVDPAASLVTIDVPERLPRLPPPIELAVYRVVQEAIANVIRHSGATRLSVAARLESGVLTVWVIDNGRGFTERAVDTGHRHLGLVSMRERAAFAGGRLELESSPGRGTKLCLRVPTAAATAGHEAGGAS